MTKKLLTSFIIIAYLFTSNFIVFAVDNPQATIADSKLKFQMMNDNIMNTNKQLADLNINISNINTSINKNTLDIAKNNRDIETEKLRVEQLEKEVNSTQELASKRLRAIYISGYNENIITVLLSSSSLSDFFDKYDALKNIISYDKNVFNTLMKKKKALNESLLILDNKTQTLQQLKTINEERLKQVSDAKNSLQTLILKFNEEKASSLQIIKDNEEKLISHSLLLIDSPSSSIKDMENSLETLKSLVSQLSTASVREKANSYITTGNKKLSDLIAKSAVQAVNGSDSYEATFTMSATAYTGGTLTALGLKPVRDQATLSTIAVDPSVIPLGTKVYIPGYGNAICSDTGGAIQGDIIDLYMNSEEDCINWGRRNVTLYVIAYPGEW